LSFRIKLNGDTWIEKDDGFKRGELVVVDLNVAQWLHNQIEHTRRYFADLATGHFGCDDAAVAENQRIYTADGAARSTKNQIFTGMSFKQRDLVRLWNF
jgi:hypothetical protein